MSFLAHKENGLLIKTSTVLSGVRHGFSTRIGGVSPAPWDSLNLGIHPALQQKLPLPQQDRVAAQVRPLGGFGRIFRIAAVKGHNRHGSVPFFMAASGISPGALSGDRSCRPRRIFCGPPQRHWPSWQ